MKGRIHQSGCIELWVNGALVAEHRLIAEKALGKPLPKAAVVHHIDGNKQNNVNTNLVICSNQSYHTLLHKREQWINYLTNPGATGITYNRFSYVARITLNRKDFNIGSFSTKEEAITARCQVVKSLLSGHPFKGEYL